jgi:iron complex outermembrane receptor protein
MQSVSVRRRTLATGLACALFAAAPAFAQNEDALEEVIVTGSRIIETPAEATSQIVAVEREDIDRSGVDSIGKLLQALPANTGSPRNTNTNNGGDGSTRIDLRGLGDCRTIVLVNGRRFPSGGSGGDCSPDVDMIPLSLIERVEVLASGASSVYGADAIGGVVNIITRAGFEGIEAGISYLVTEESDGDTTNGYFLAGQALESGNVVVGFDYTDQQPVLGGAREYSSETELLTADQTGFIPSGSPTTPQGSFVVPPGNVFGLPFVPPPFGYTLIAGENGDAATDFRPFDPVGDRYNFAPVNYLQTASRRTGFWVQGDYDTGHGVELGLEFLTHHRESDQLLASAPYTSNEFNSAPVLANGMQGVPGTNYYNPFGVDTFNVRRRFVESGGRGFEQEVDAQRIALTADGDFGEGWKWSGALAWYDNQTLTRRQGALRTDRLQQALGPSGPDGSGRIVCGAPDPGTGIVPDAAIIEDCVPLDLFSGVGTITADMLDYVAQPLVDSGSNEQLLVNFDTRGQLGSTPAGAIRWAFGVEYREDRTELDIDPAILNGTAGNPAEFAVLDGGSFRAREAFAETLIPLVRDRPALYDLTLTASGRYSNFSSFGDATTWQSGLRWAPTSTISLRGSYGRVFRAPPNGDLFWAPVDGLDEFAFDPCGNDPTAEQQVNCAANGVPGGSYVQTEGIPTTQGGNPELAAEEGNSLTYGIEWRPALADGLIMSVDAWRVDLDGRIGALGLDTVLNGCADLGAESVCSAIERNPDGSIVTVDLRQRNLANVFAQGVDAAIEWSTATNSGEWGARLNATYYDTYEITPFDGASALTIAGQFSPDFLQSFPRVRAVGHVQWSRSPWIASWSAQFIDNLIECGEVFVPGAYNGCLTSDSVLFQDMQFGWQPERGPRLTVSVMNLTDEDPPRLNFESSFNTDQGTYRLLGRTYMMRLAYGAY